MDDCRTCLYFPNDMTAEDCLRCFEFSHYSPIGACGTCDYKRVAPDQTPCKGCHASERYEASTRNEKDDIGEELYNVINVAVEQAASTLKMLCRIRVSGDLDSQQVAIKHIAYIESHIKYEV